MTVLGPTAWRRIFDPSHLPRTGDGLLIVYRPDAHTKLIAHVFPHGEHSWLIGGAVMGPAELAASATHWMLAPPMP